MTFINARNNLSVSGPQSVNMMEKIGSSERINVLAELGTSDDKGISRRYEIKKDTVPSQITSPYQSMEDSDMGDWKTLSEFAKWGVKNYPAKHYMLIVWGHGLGRRDPESDIGVGQERGISFDDSTGNFIRNSQLGRALKDIGVKLDVYASDACIMQMASVVYEIKDSAEFIVGSEETIFTFSFPYEAILKRLDSGDISALQASKIITEEYQKMYKIPPPGFKGTTISAVRAGALPAFVKNLNSWIAQAAKPAMHAGIKSSAEKTLGFYYHSANQFNPMSKDLYHFISLATASTGDNPALRAESNKLLRFMKDELIVSNKISGGENGYSNAHGLAIYMPQFMYDTSYDETAFAKISYWDDFLKWILEPGYEIKNKKK